MVDRRTTILKATTALIEAFDQWAASKETVIEEQSPLGLALDVVINACRYGDVPGDCREIVEAVGKLGVRYHAYNFEDEFQTSTGEPLPVFYDAYKGVLEAYQGVRYRVDRRVIESVAALKAEGLDSHQIARCYGRRNHGTGIWEGVFFGPQGQTLLGLIEQELQKPGSVITTDWRHPDDETEAESVRDRLAGRLARAEQLAEVTKTDQFLKEEAQKPPVNEDDVVDYLREGAFPQQVVSRFGLTIDQVNSIARKHGIVKEDDVDETEPVKIGEQEQEQEQEQEKTLADRCAELSADGKNPSQIAGIVSKEFKRPIKTGDVVGLLSESVKTIA